MIIDFHNHYYPPEFISAVQKGPSNFRVTDDDQGNPEPVGKTDNRGHLARTVGLNQKIGRAADPPTVVVGEGHIKSVLSDILLHQLVEQTSACLTRTQRYLLQPVLLCLFQVPVVV